MDFCEKNPHSFKITKNDQKWPKNRSFGLFKKIKSLILSGNWCKTKILMALKYFCKNCMPEKNLILRLYNQKRLLYNHASHSNVWLVRDQDPLALELRASSFSYVKL